MPSLMLCSTSFSLFFILRAFTQFILYYLIDMNAVHMEKILVAYILARKRERRLQRTVTYYSPSFVATKSNPLSFDDLRNDRGTIRFSTNPGNSLKSIDVFWIRGGGKHYKR
ncbi:unnamed protein product [Rhizophagus irregularis]|nr:unnamed protein product [Rhizophagus irregularis]